MASVVISGDTSGTVTLSVPAVAGSTTINLPATSGTVAFPPYGTSQISDGAITAAKLDGAQTGSAPAYAARAWVNFNGTGTVAIRASGNVTSITDNGVGNYTANFTTAMPDANYAYTSHYDFTIASTANTIAMSNEVSRAAGSLQLLSQSTAGTATDVEVFSIAVFR